LAQSEPEMVAKLKAGSWLDNEYFDGIEVAVLLFRLRRDLSLSGSDFAFTSFVFWGGLLRLLPKRGGDLAEPTREGAV